MLKSVLERARVKPEILTSLEIIGFQGKYDQNLDLSGRTRVNSE